MSKLVLSIALFALVAFAFVHASGDIKAEAGDDPALLNEVVPDDIQITPRISCQLGGEGACVIRCIRMGRKSGYCRSGICYCTR